jgi:hypothetical protein
MASGSENPDLNLGSAVHEFHDPEHVSSLNFSFPYEKWDLRVCSMVICMGPVS